jgi:hypothetical protein
MPNKMRGLIACAHELLALSTRTGHALCRGSTVCMHGRIDSSDRLHDRQHAYQILTEVGGHMPNERKESIATSLVFNY